MDAHRPQPGRRPKLGIGVHHHRPLPHHQRRQPESTHLRLQPQMLHRDHGRPGQGTRGPAAGQVPQLSGERLPQRLRISRRVDGNHRETPPLIEQGHVPRQSLRGLSRIHVRSHHPQTGLGTVTDHLPRRPPFQVLQGLAIPIGQHRSHTGEEGSLQLHIASLPGHGGHGGPQPGLPSGESRQEGWSEERLGRRGFEDHGPAHGQGRQQRLDREPRQIGGEDDQHWAGFGGGRPGPGEDRRRRIPPHSAQHRLQSGLEPLARETGQPGEGWIERPPLQRPRAQEGRHRVPPGGEEIL